MILRLFVILLIFRQAWTSEILSGKDEFRVTSYNILADVYADSDYSRTVLFAQVCCLPSPPWVKGCPEEKKKSSVPSRLGT